MNDVPEQQNPLLDIPNKVDQAVLEKIGQKAGDVVDMEGSEYLAGGVTQNSIRVAQWMLQEKATSHIGCGGENEYAHKMQATCEKDTCACCIVDTERSMYVDLKAEIYYKVDHLKEHIAVLEKVSVVCSTGFFIKVSPELITLASSLCNEKGKTYCMNLSAPFIMEVPPFTEVLMKTMPNIDVLFGNETEARELVSSCFVFVPLLAPAPAPKMRSNTTNDIELNGVFLLDVIFSSTCPACPKILTTTPNKWQIRPVQQSFGNIGTSRTTMRSATTRLKRSTR